MEFKVPEIAENVTSGTVVSIFVSVGDHVKKGQDMFELESEKASLPVPSPCEGTVTEILVNAGDEVKVGQAVMKINESSGESAEAKPETPSPEKKGPAAQEPKAPEEPKKEDKPSAGTASVPQATAVKPNEEIPAQTDVPAAPSVRRFAREIGVEISKVTGTEPGGRISEEDVKAYAKRVLTGVEQTGTTAPAVEPLPDFAKWGEIKRKAMTNVRKKTASHLSLCWNTIPHVTHFDKADITDLDKLRKEYSTKEHKLTITPFLVKILVGALKEFPQFNASIDMATQEIIYKKYYHIGVAIDTERGLLVPPVRDVDKKNILELARELDEITEKAHNRKLSFEDLKGGCITLTNLGGIGGTAFTPIINWPEVAILGIARGAWEPRYEDGHFVPHFMLPLCLSYDHRVIDGADAARFLQWVVEAIERPLFMELEG